MKKVIVSLLLLGCSSAPQSSNYFGLSTIKNLAELTLIEPPPAIISVTPVYVIGINDSISQSNIIDMRNVYQAIYSGSYPEFSDFLFDALNQNIKFAAKNPNTYYYYTETFSVAQKIKRIYEERNVLGLLKMYCYYDNGYYTLNRETLSLNEINSISYYLFLNQYMRIDDDYGATINFKKLNAILN